VKRSMTKLQGDKKFCLKKMENSNFYHYLMKPRRLEQANEEATRAKAKSVGLCVFSVFKYSIISPTKKKLLSLQNESKKKIP